MQQQALRCARAAFLDVEGEEEERVAPIAVPSAWALDLVEDGSEGEGEEKDEDPRPDGMDWISVEEAYPDGLGDPDASRAVDEDARAASEE